jgi:hypothetical protein
VTTSVQSVPQEVRDPAKSSSESEGFPSFSFGATLYVEGSPLFMM